jgi:uncharacterized membrane protein
MKIEYSLLALVLALVYGIITQFLPDFPLSLEVLSAFIVYVLVKLGVEVVAPPIRKYFNK